ncbi:uncharacterized protein LOC143041920 isoform X3 [Mytilus galloprovincialis]|uniref:uncharacterized protein LOC143041920 isoform X3 n=1 Tax=Mytilus galloprovincialis TaxID=29158 RepID=UPI003F7B6145
MGKKKGGHNTTKKRHIHDKNKQGKKENSDEDEQKNQKEEQNEKENVTFLTTCFRLLKGLVVFLCCTLPLMPYKIVRKIIICIWTNFCAICGTLTKMLNFSRKKKEEEIEIKEENGDVKTRSKSRKKLQKQKILEQETRQFTKSTSESNGKLNVKENEKETTLKRISEYEEELKTMESQKNSALNRIKESETQLNLVDKEKSSALKRITDFEKKLKAAESAKGVALKKITELEAHLKSTEKEKTSAIKRVKDFEQKLKAQESDKEDALKRVKDFELKLKAAETDKEDASKKMKESETKLNAIEKEKTSALKRVKDIEQKLKTAESEKGEALKKLTEYKAANVYLQREHTNALERITEAEKSVRLLSQEKSDALTRLSDIMGTKLRDNNPAITDLNDPNRPMKLGDQFSELYENEWTDAYSEISDCKNLNLSEIETIAVLLNILKEIYKICSEDIEEQLSGHKKLVNGFSDDEIELFLKTAKDSVKTNAANYIPLLYRKIISSTSACELVAQYKDFSLQYIENCVKICYFAAVQNPPMVIDFEPGQMFDKQSYREYTRSGNVVEYLVWPVLYLHKGGPILSKGVVQPKEENNSNK